MKIEIILFMILCILSKNSLSQTKVIDNETNKGIPFASVIYLKDPNLQGGYTDSLGNFKLQILNLELQISCIGYQTLVINGNDLKINQTIKLKPLVYDLSAVEIKPRKHRTMQLGYFKSATYNKLVDGKTALTYRKLTNYIAQLIPNPKKEDGLYINKLKYNLSNHFKKPDPVNERGCEPTLLRVHLFKIDKFGKPGEELLTRNIVFKNDCQKDNLIVDISDENILMPTNGVFAGLEFIDNSRSVLVSSYPFYVLNLAADNKQVLNTYVSNHQEKWENIIVSAGSKDGRKVTASFNAQFGIEVIK